ncbi:glutathione S-transferase [Aliidongia dinghuensis]|uniref:Glutathione S-transferase n=1 Tax=Aliidongia dinghuensis TaxID=1867774 RepID=A0A8J2Z015_9PROT|nr:glutathione S-transferase [Aliidongia dinghuensis]GGF40117.1 glutathione S-transferase [Aliidongia dinghuensis]
MKLLYSAASPYVRKVMVVAHETGLAGKIELVPSTVAPTLVNSDVAAKNPLVKVPTLVLDDGTGLFDSRVIAEYLDSLHGGHRLFPAEGPARWTALRRQATADGLLDAALLVRYEHNLRPEPQRWAAWSEGQFRKIRQALAALAAERLGGSLTIGEIAAGCALGYLDFRFPEEDWRSAHPTLAAWYADVAERPSFVATVPKA